MSDNVENAVFEILKKIQGDIAAFRADVSDFKRDNHTEHERMELLIRNSAETTPRCWL